jgi:predicted HicB family RNase H-like nuclease
VDIPVSLHRKIKIQAVQEGVKLNELAIRLFEEYLSKVSKE